MPKLSGIVNPIERLSGESLIGSLGWDLGGGALSASGEFEDPVSGVKVGWAKKRNVHGEHLSVFENKVSFLVICGDHFLEGADIVEPRPSELGACLATLEDFERKLLRKLNGSFAGVLVDRGNCRIVLFNDRYGLFRIYWHRERNAFYFASEAKDLLRLCPETRRLDQGGLAEHLSCGCALEGRSQFHGVFLLPPASLWIFGADGSLKEECYFNPKDWEEQEPLLSPEYFDRLASVLSNVVPRYTGSGERRAVSVTGGMDSRLVMAWSNCRPGELPCYTFGGGFRDSFDVQIGRRVAEASCQSHSVLSVDGDFLGSFLPLAVETIQLSDGAMDVSGAVELYVNRIARNIAPVRITGNYGSEILRRLVAFKPGAISPVCFSPELVQGGEAARVAYSDLLNRHPLSFIAFCQVPWFHHARFSIESSEVTPRSPFLDNELVALAYRSSLRKKELPQFLMRLVSAGNPKLSAFPGDRGNSVLRPNIFTKARSVWQEFTFKAEYAFDYGMPQWLARLSGLVPGTKLERFFLGRHKFYHFRLWYRDQLAAPLKEVLLDPKTLSRPFFKRKGLERIVNDHTRGIRNWTLELHQALSLELTIRYLLENWDR